MKDLVIMKDKKAVTTSLQVADAFEKQHKDVLEAIDNKIQSAENSADYKKMFFEDFYLDSRNRKQRMYYMNRDGFSFIAFGFTGKKADDFKFRYIEAFNYMENHIKYHLMEAEDIMIETLQTQKELKKQISSVSEDVEELKKEVDLSRYQKSQLSNLVKRNVMDAVGGKSSNAYRELYRTAVAEHWRAIKNHFGVASYEEIPKLRFDEAMELASMWTPSASLAYDIKKLNTQIEMEV